MPGGLLVRLASRFRHHGGAPAAREAREEAEFEAKFRPKWEAWKLSMSFKDKWYFAGAGPEGYVIDCPVESVIYPQGAMDVDMPKSQMGWGLREPPWDRPDWYDPLHMRLLEIISGEYNNPDSPAKADAESLDLDEREYGWYMAKEHFRAREYGRRSRLDDVCGGKAEDDYDWDTMGPRGLTYDESWGREHPSIYVFRQGKGLKFYWM
ncbi:MAG: hypothetical protein L6R38_005677 [Xanthoria sp. 2 TBL-2021]|nr:MAG: hypothetical protein L6R38_005677 [Xanthoria sp. 2 TBL-2021]